MYLFKSGINTCTYMTYICLYLRLSSFSRTGDYRVSVLKMNSMLIVFLCCLLTNAVKASVSQRTKLESLISLIFNNAKATVTLNSSELKQLLQLSRSTSG